MSSADECGLCGGPTPCLTHRQGLPASQSSADSAPMRSMTPQEEEAVQRSLLASGTPLYDLPQASDDSAQSVAQYIGTLKDALRAARDELIKHDSEYHHFTDPFVKRLVFDAILSEPAHAQPQASADRDGFNKEDFADDGAYLARFSTAPTVPQTAPIGYVSQATLRLLSERGQAGHICPVPAYDTLIPVYAGPVQRCQAESAATTAWECSARKQGTAGGNNPSDCDWPGCGCDPQANKVLEAIDEAGFEIVRKPEIRRMAHPQPQANNALRGFGWRSDCPACVASKMVCDAHGSALMRPQAVCAEPSEAQIYAAAEVIWNDRDARMGGPWKGRGADEVCVIQTRATARAALVAALTRPVCADEPAMPSHQSKSPNSTDVGTAS